jgi:transcriptional regulator with XRE-family HTH domain
LTLRKAKEVKKVNTPKKLKAYREMKDLTMRQVADELGVSESCYCLYENGLRKPSFETLVKLAQIYGCTVNDFI